MAGTIMLAAVLRRINDYVGDGDGVEPFCIKFVTSEGKLRTFARARRGGKDIQKGETKGTKAKEFYRLKEKHVVLLHDLDEGRDKSVKVHKIVEFEGMRVKH